MRKKNISFNIRCSPEWLAQKKQAADANEMTVSDYIRKAAEEEYERSNDERR